MAGYVNKCKHITRINVIAFFNNDVTLKKKKVEISAGRRREV